MSNSVNFGIPFINTGQAYKEGTHNDGVAIVDILLRGTADSIETSPPATSDGKTVLVVDTGATGAFATFENNIAYWLVDAGSWQFITPVENQLLRIGATSYLFLSGVWVAQPASVLTASGVYTPTPTNVTNLAASTAYALQYSRTGDVVNVSGVIDADPTAAGACELGITLPVTSTLAAAGQCAGAGASESGEAVVIKGDVANARASLVWVAADLTNHPIYFSFSYRVL